MSDVSMNRSPRFKKTLYIILFVAILLALLWYFWPQATPSKNTGDRPWRRGTTSLTAVPVTAVDVVQAPYAVELKALGTVIPWNNVNVVSQVGGELVEVLFTEGQYVEAGDVLAKIDPRSYQAAVDQAQGSLNEQRAQLSHAEKELVRYQNLIKQDSVAKQTLDAQQALVNQYRANLQTRQAQLDNAKLDLDHTQITAPIAGRLGLRKVDQGNIVSANSTELVSITQDRPIAVTFTIPERDLLSVLRPFNQGEKLAVQAWSRDERELISQGVLESIDNQVDVATGSVRLKARFSNDEGLLFPNQFVNVRLHTRTYPDALIVPADAVQYGARGSFVWLIDQEDMVSVQDVQVELSNGQMTMLNGGVKAGDTVVLEGVDRLRTGSKIERVAAQPSLNPDAQTPVKESSLGVSVSADPAFTEQDQDQEQEQE